MNRWVNLDLEYVLPGPRWEREKEGAQIVPIWLEVAKTFIHLCLPSAYIYY